MTSASALSRQPAPGPARPRRGPDWRARGGGRDRRGSARRRPHRPAELAGARGRPGRDRPHAAAGQELRHLRVRLQRQDRAARRHPGGARPVRGGGRDGGGPPPRVRHVGARALRLHRPGGRPDQAQLDAGIHRAHPGRRRGRGVRAHPAGPRGGQARPSPDPGAPSLACPAFASPGHAGGPDPAGSSRATGRPGSSGGTRGRDAGLFLYLPPQSETIRDRHAGPDGVGSWSPAG